MGLVRTTVLCHRDHTIRAFAFIVDDLKLFDSDVLLGLEAGDFNDAETFNVTLRRTF